MMAKPVSLASLVEAWKPAFAALRVWDGGDDLQAVEVNCLAILGNVMHPAWLTGDPSTRCKPVSTHTSASPGN
jgi:hypothetical protein